MNINKTREQFGDLFINLQLCTNETLNLLKNGKCDINS